MNIIQHLEAAGLTEEFVTLARTGVGNAELTAWAKSKPALAKMYRPLSWKDIRIRLDCRAQRGGHRPLNRPLKHVMHTRRTTEGVRSGRKNARERIWE